MGIFYILMIKLFVSVEGWKYLVYRLSSGWINS